MLLTEIAAVLGTNIPPVNFFWEIAKNGLCKHLPQNLSNLSEE